MNRRKLLSWFGLGWLVSILPSSLIGCSDTASTSKTSSATPESVAAAPSDNFKSIGTVAQLDKDGQLVYEKVAVVRDPQNANALLAVNATCTHKGCIVKWKSDKKQYVCPCHDAEFTANGTVIAGPADKPLIRYNAKIDKGYVLVSI